LSKNGGSILGRWWRYKWITFHPSLTLIHTWSDLAGLTFDGYNPTRSLVNPQFRESTRWIGNPYKKNGLTDFDSLPYGNKCVRDADARQKMKCAWFR
ncbi:hypothetical protein ACYEYE_21865, partial [Escherichia coli]